MDAPKAIMALQRDPGTLEAKRLECANWWQVKKRVLLTRVREQCTLGFAGHILWAKPD
jgi:hypothetical protein